MGFAAEKEVAIVGGREDKRMTRSEYASALLGEDMDPIVDVMEQGLFIYIASILEELYKINHVSGGLK